MFFLLRSACCIGLVVAALPTPSPRPGDLVDFTPGGVLGGAEALCRSEPSRCLDLLGATGHAGTAQTFLALAGQARSRASRDTLTAADRAPAWSGPDRSLD